MLVLIASAASLVIGFSQYFDYVVTNPETKLPDGLPLVYAVKGLMGHKNFFSSGLMMLLPFLGFAIYNFKGTLKTIGIVAFSLIIILLVLLETRAVWVGTLVGAFVFVLTLILLAPKFNVARNARLFLAGGLLISLVAFAVIMLSGGGENEKTYLDRLKTITSPNSGNNSYRIRAWNATLEMISDHPITGVGTGNWKIHSQKYISDKNFTQDETNWIRPHNDYLWSFAERGFFGFLLFISLFGISVFYALKLLLSEKTSPSVKITILILLSGLVGYMFESFFTFPYERINQQVYLTIFIAGITAEYLRINPEKEFKPDQKTIFVVTGLLLLFSIVYGISMIKSEYHIVIAKAAGMSKNWKLEIEEAEKAKTPFRNLEPEASPINYFIGNGYLDAGNLKLAAEYYQKAIKESPFDPFILSNLGKCYADLGDYKKAVVYLEEALNLLPSFYEAKVNLGTAYYGLKQYRKSLKTLNSIPQNARNEIINGNIKALKDLIALENQNKKQAPPDSIAKPDKKVNLKSKAHSDSSKVGNVKKKGNQKKQNLNNQQKKNKTDKVTNKNIKKTSAKDTTKANNAKKNKKKQDKKIP